ncbi:MAG TPA: UDP-N-acetylmuramoyl-L-alanyl-D-glutamate--2,6-diaminopimelate ligase [Novimethylophilus sp.]|jgi:UDP-N-acetylmuramoyl-L-alanyl-D-glutamate--2,6-diaminopimelate ligase|uniref:UDP-N-acetylmuramoyl-L-alanyl-D-glutamate--2, 6-diaminopimelate ligase n=1 Tax=Novimethylophilus sp. TaxID=2137426 RepID=UPI002F406667
MSVLQQLMEAGVKPRRLVSDSRRVEVGDVFVAYPGETADGRAHIAQAIAHGAAAVLWEQKAGRWSEEWRVTNIAVDELREQVGVIAGEFFDHPSQKLWMIGVTGTNGKTSCSHWLAQCLTPLGRKTAVVGTLGNGFPHALSEAINTTPDPIALQSQLADFVVQGAQAVAMEVSSHGLAQGRVNGIRFDVAVLTNLSRDHLDYHGSMEAYAAAKAQLFGWPELKHAVLNADDAFGVQLAEMLRGQGKHVLTYGLEKGDVACRALSLNEDGIVMDVVTPQGGMRIAAPVLGRFNAANVLAVLAVLLASDIPLPQAAAALRHITPVPGRMQQLGGGALPLVVVDYAHTPDALAKVLGSLREQCRGRLFCVFGCGGNRDKGKRQLMGGIASRQADYCIVTSDNPRHENPRAIIDEIIAGMDGDYRIEEDRAAAVDSAIRAATAGDIVVLAGKGHETYQLIGDRKLPFSDIEVARRVLDSMGKTA